MGIPFVADSTRRDYKRVSELAQVPQEGSPPTFHPSQRLQELGSCAAQTKAANILAFQTAV